MAVNVTPPPRPTLLCADDFGLRDSIDTAILSLAGNGQIDRVSCLVGGASFHRNISKLLPYRDGGVRLGLHLCLTDQMQSCSGPDAPMTGGDSRFQPLPKLLRAVWSGHLQAAAAIKEWRAQILRFQQTTGQWPAYLDSHEHIHQLKIFHPVMQTLMAEFAIDDVRQTSSYLPFQRGLVARGKRWVVRWTGRQFARQLRTSGRSPFRSTTGVLDYARLSMSSWQRCARELGRNPPPGVVEWIVHPEALTGDGPYTPEQHGRNIEFKCLSALSSE